MQTNPAVEQNKNIKYVRTLNLHTSRAVPVLRRRAGTARTVDIGSYTHFD